MEIKERLKNYLLPEKKAIILSFISVLVFLISQLMVPYLVGKSLDALGKVTDGIFIINVNTNLIALYLSICLGLAVLGVFFDYIFEYQVGVMTQHAVKRIRDDVFKKFNSISIKDVDSDTIGNLVQYEIGDVENIANGIYSVFKQLVQGVLTILITVVMMFTVNWILALGVIILSPLSILVSKFVATFSHKHFKKQAQLMSDLNSLSLESISNASTIQSLNYQERSLDEFKKRDEKLRKEGQVAQFSASWTNPSTRLVNNTIYAIIGISGIIMIMYTASYPILAMTIGSLSSFLSYTTEYTKQIGRAHV